MFGMGGQLHGYSDEEQDLGKIYDRVLMRRLVSYMKPYRVEVILLACLLIGGMLAQLAGPYLLHLAIDRHIQPRNLDGLEFIVLTMITVMVAHLVFSYLNEYRMQMLGQRIMNDIRKQIFSHLQRLDVKYFDPKPRRAVDDPRNGGCPSAQRTLHIGSNHDFRESVDHYWHHGGDGSDELEASSCNLYGTPNHLHCNDDLPSILPVARFVISANTSPG